jgi:hypothetical protein
MKPHLIIDISEKIIYSIIVDTQGNTLPCSINTGSHDSDYIEPGIMLAGFLQENNILEELDKPKNSGLKDMINNPFNGLFDHDKSAIISHDKEVYNFFYQIIKELFRPLTNSINSYGFHPSDINVIVIIPEYSSRICQKIVNRTLKMYKFKKIIYLNHTLALALHQIASFEADKFLIIKSESMRLHVDFLICDKSTDDVVIERTGSLSFPEYGFNSQKLVPMITDVMYRKKLLKDKTQQVNESMEKAIISLLTGLYNKSVDDSKYKSLNYGDIEKALRNMHHNSSLANLGQTILSQWKHQFKHAITHLPVILSGFIFQFQSFVNSFIEQTHLEYPMSQFYGIDCATDGVVKMLQWLYENDHSSIRFKQNNSIRVPVKDHSTRDILPSSIFPLTDGKKYISKLKFDFQKNDTADNNLATLNFLWGHNLRKEFNTSLVNFSYELDTHDLSKKYPVEIVFDLFGTKDGFSGKIISNYKDQTQISKVYIPQTLEILNQNTFL